MSTPQQNELLDRTINHFRQQSQKIVELSQGMMALIVTLQEMLPGFAEAYAQHHRDAGLQLESLGISVPADLFAELSVRFRRNS